MSVSSKREVRPGPGAPSPAQLAQSRHDFLVSDRLLLSPEQMMEYSDHWVAAYRGKVELVDEDFDSLMDHLKARGLPLGSVAVRFIEKDGMASP